MKLLLRHITWSDNSKGRYLIVNSDKGATGRTKITVKQWNFFKKMGVGEDKMETSLPKLNDYSYV